MSTRREPPLDFARLGPARADTSHESKRQR